MKSQINKLRELSAEIERINRLEKKKLKNVSKRLSADAQLHQFTIRGTRPSSDLGVTFYLSHTYVSKRNSRSTSAAGLDQTTAAAFQKYIERKCDVQKIEEREWSIHKDIKQGCKSLKGPKWKPIPVEEENPVFSSPRIFREPGYISFGNLGRTPHDRENFWRQLEQAEGRIGRIQSRMAIELPCEVGSSTHLAIARAYSRIFEEKNFPYWLVAHAPNKNNDKRNYHIHIVYTDRPARTTNAGTWDFSILRTKKTSKHKPREARVYKLKKDRTAHSSDWIKTLRIRYAEIANREMANVGIEKRYDPRSYKESGVQKTPTRHLGAAANALEKRGISTRTGRENTAIETQYRLQRGEIFFSTRDALRNKIEEKLNRVDREFSPQNDIDDLSSNLEQHRVLGLEGRTIYEKIEVHKIASEAVTIRLKDRHKYLSEESERLYYRTPVDIAVDSFALAMALDTEKEMIRRTKLELDDFVKKCADTVIAQSRVLKDLIHKQNQLLVGSLNQLNCITAANIKCGKMQWPHHELQPSNQSNEGKNLYLESPVNTDNSTILLSAITPNPESLESTTSTTLSAPESSAIEAILARNHSEKDNAQIAHTKSGKTDLSPANSSRFE